MKTTRLILVVTPLLLIIFLSACSAEDSAPGPQGLQGEQGKVGPQGEQGPAGADGVDGADGIDANSTVISSGWFEINPWDTDLPDFKFHRIPDLILSEFQIENDLILVYRRYQPTPTLTQVAALPVAEYNATGEPVLLLTNRVQGNGLVVQIQAFGRNVANDEYLGPETQFRYMIIEPTSTSDKRRRVDFSKMSYQEVVDFFGLDQ